MKFDIQSIVAALPRKSPGIIAVDGGSGSGKSTLGQELADALGVGLVSLDDFLLNVDDDVLDRRSPEQNFLEAFDRGAVTAALIKLRSSSTPAVVEGVYSFRPEWEALIDFKIWIEMTPELRLERMQIRGANTPSQMRLWQATEDWYMRTFNPAGLADLTVNGSTGMLVNTALPANKKPRS